MLGQNAVDYARSMPQEEERAQFHWARRKIDLVARALRALPRLSRAADIGCRSGAEAAYYRQQAGVAEMHGFDIAEPALRAAAARGIVTHVWVSGREPCPAPDEFFDAIVAGDVIEHLEDTDVFLEELRRVLRPEGRLIVTTPNLAWWWSRLRLLFGKIPESAASVSWRHSLDRAVDRKHLRVSVVGEWRHLFVAHGFDVASIAGYHYPDLLRSPFRPVDALLSRRPTLAHSALFVLRKASAP